MRLALVHDYLSQDGGAERVLKAMHEIWPEAPIFLLFHDRQKLPQFGDADIRESFLARLPGGRTRYQWYLPWMPLATERLNLSGFDVVLSTSSLFAKGVITHPGTLHISYCHTPPRFLWADTHEYVDELNYNGLVKAFLPPVIHRLRLWDKMSADRVDHFIANSHTVERRIQKYYRRDSTVIYPPVETNLFSLSKAIGDYFIAGGRLVPYKRTDLIVRTFNRLGWPLKIFGIGPELNYLKTIAKSNIEFLGVIDEINKSKLLSAARAFIHPQMEDFGITAVETMVNGRPVIAYGQGGATETVIAGETGLLFEKQTWESLLNTLLNFDYNAWDSAKIQAHAQKFSAHHFKNNLKEFVDHRFEEFKRGLKQPALLSFHASTLTHS